MIQKINMLILTLGMTLAFAAPAAVPATVVAAPNPNAEIQGNLCQGANFNINPTTGKAECTAAEGIGGFQKTLEKIINIISILVGIVAVIMIIYGGFRYITSGGTAEKVTSAKNTILYGLIGLIIVALAQVIVRFVLKETTGA